MFLKGKKKWIFGGIFLVLVVFLSLILVSRSKNQNHISVKVTAVEESEITSTIISNGVITAKQQKKIISDLPYLIEEVFVSEGDKVDKGDPLIKIDTKELEYNLAKEEYELELLKDEFESLCGGIKQQEIYKDLQDAKLTYDNAAQNFARTKKLFEEKVISEAEFLEEELEWATAKNDYELLQKKYQDILQEAELKERELQLQHLKIELQKERLQDALLTSPIKGTVVLVDTEKGLEADSVSPLIIIDDTDNLEVEIKVSEYDVNEITLGQNVQITGEAFKGKELEGKVSFIAPLAEVRENGSEKETSVVVKIDILNPDAVLKPGFSADVEINTASKEKALVVPYESLYKKQDGTNVVLKVVDNIVQEIPVSLGIEGELKIEVFSGELQAGDKIIINPTEALQDGLEVNIINQGELK